MNDLKYTDLLTTLFNTIPEAGAAYDQWEMPGEPLPYIVFSFLEESFFTPAMQSEDHDLKERIFRFIERMAISNDSDVVTLLWLGLFEVCAANGTLSLVLQDLKPRSRSLARKALKEFLKPKPRLS